MFNVGQEFQSNGFGKFKILEVGDWKSIKVQFIDTGFITITRSDKIRSGSIKDRLAKNAYGVGYLGDGETEKRSLSLWFAMLCRCYNPEYHKNKPSYVECSVSKYFENYTNFKSWCFNQTGFKQEGWHLDKDLICKGNKIYSESTCCFVPSEINTAIVNNKAYRGDYPLGTRLDKRSGKYQVRVNRGGRSYSLGYFKDPTVAFNVYKEAKEKHLKDLAEKYKDVIDPRAYNALLNYEVKITD